MNLTMATDIDSAIQEHRAEIDRRRREIEIMEAELRGMERVRTLLTNAGQGRSAAPPDLGALPAKERSRHDDARREPRRGGRQPGSITQASQRKLRELHAAYGASGFSEQEYVNWLRERGERCKPSDAERQRKAFMSGGYLEEADDGRYRVTEFAAQKYGFQAPAHPVQHRRDSSGNDDETDVQPETPQERQVPAGAKPEEIGSDERAEPKTPSSDELTATHDPAEPG